MVKLLRLTSEDNCNFNVNMDADLVVSESAEIALKNLTFESLFEVLSISGFKAPVEDTNGSIIFGADNNVYGDSVSFLTPTTYNNTNYLQFFTDLKKTLNSTLEPIKEDDSVGAGTPGQQFYGSFDVLSESDFKSIAFRLSPVLVPIVSRDTQDIDPATFATTNNFMSASYGGAQVPDIEVVAKANPVYAGDMALVKRTAGEAEGESRSHYYVANNPSTTWCQGSAVFWCRINELSDNGETSAKNGMEIGLSRYQGFDTDSDLDGTEIMFSLRVKKPADPVEYVVPDATFNPTGTPVVSIGNTPTNPVKPVTAEQDILLIQRERFASGQGVVTRIVGYIFRDGQVPLTVFSYELRREDEGVKLYPFICMYGAAGNAVMSQPSLTIDPFEIDNRKENGFNDLIKPANGNKFAGVTSFKEITDAYTTPNETDIPDLNEEWYGSYGLTANTELNIDRSVLRFMGFDQTISRDGTGRHIFRPTISTTSFPFGFILEASDIFQATQSDNYVVVLDSHKLISYDCSERRNPQNFDVIGKRLNILATVPISDGTGIVEFDAAEVQYIDMDNKAPIVIRNLQLRVLDKALNEIDTTGLSVMTLLIKDKPE